MHEILPDELRALKPEEIKSLKEKAKKGDCMAQWKMAMCILYAQTEVGKGESIFTYLNPAIEANEPMALLLMGYIYEHAFETSKNYAKAVECYCKAYDVLNEIQSTNKSDKKDVTGTLREIEKRYDKLVKQVTQVVSIKKFCHFKDGQFLFPWTDETRNSIKKILPQLSSDIASYGVLHKKVITNLQEEKQGQLEFCFQDTLLMPIEVMKTLAARDVLNHFFEENGLQYLPSDPFFNNALGRCLIDDDDAYDNDYIIGGLLNMAGHEGDPLWQYRVGLWYEYCDNNLEPKTAAYWYEKAKDGIPAAKIALGRLEGSLQYRILENPKEGTAKDCQSLYSRSSKNPQNSISWIIESAMRGDASAIQRLEQKQFTPKGKTSIFSESFEAKDNETFYSLLKEEASADKKVIELWSRKMQKEKDEYRKRVEEEERRRKEEERKRLEAERKAEEERIRKIKEAEEAKRRAEEERIRKEKEAAEEAIRKAKKAEEDRIRKAKEAEEAKRRAEEDAKRKAKADEEAKRRAEEAQKRETELCNKYLAELKNIEKDYNSLHAKWEKYGAAEMKSLSKEWGSPVEYGKDFLNVAANRQWWQYPFYVQGEWTVSKLQVKNKEVFEILKKKEEIIDCTSNKLKKLFDTNGIELKSKASRNEISRNEEIAQAIRRNCYRLY